jgi:hypothetical protein
MTSLRRTYAVVLLASSIALIATVARLTFHRGAFLDNAFGLPLVHEDPLAPGPGDGPLGGRGGAGGVRPLERFDGVWRVGK